MAIEKESEFKKGFVYGVYKVLNKLEDCKNMYDISTIIEGFEDILEKDGHLITDLIEE